MEAARILVAMNNDTSICKLKQILAESGFTVVDYAKDGHECLRKMRSLRPELTVLEYDLPLMSGYDVAKIAIEDKICDIVLISSEVQKSLTDEIKRECGFVSMTKPLNKVSLVNTVEIMIKNRRKIMQLEREIQELKDTLDTRKEVEKAKGLLMKSLNLSEAEAFKRIQKQSMDKGIPMKEIAKAIILAYDI
ncbi:MAG: ANTAR domain-containing protein [Clostridia bacterium]|nr:ANTAR domain-containing protein [Clostridia bacterium]